MSHPQTKVYTQTHPAYFEYLKGVIHGLKLRLEVAEERAACLEFDYKALLKDKRALSEKIKDLEQTIEVLRAR